MSFMYFVPSTSREVPASLAYAFDGKQPAVRDVIANGPGGQAGKLFGGGRWVKDGTNFGYFADRQTWSGPNKDGVCVGYQTNEPPKVDELARETQLRGHAVKLADGHEWTVPVARAFEEGRWVSRLPQRLAYDPASGEWQYTGTEARYQRLWEIGTTWWDAFVVQKEGSAGMSNVEAIQAAVDTLGFNYCVGPVEISMLGILTDNLIAEILNAVVDLPTMDEWIKKNKQEPSGV